jgi:hypothetical protein
MAAATAAQHGVGQQLVANPYRDWYSDNVRDPFVGHYAAMYANYELANAPQVVRTRIYPNGNNGVPIGHLLLVAQPNVAPVIQGYHRVTRYKPSLVGTSPFDDVAYAFLGDVRNGQTPHTVVWDDTYFNRVAAVQVPTAANLDQLLAADPTAELVGPFAAGTADTADTEAETVRMLVFLPNRYMSMLLDDNLSRRQVWEQVRGGIVNDGTAADREPLLDWFRVALTQRAANMGSALNCESLATQVIATGRDAATFQQYRMGIVERDYPNMRAGPMTHGA